MDYEEFRSIIDAYEDKIETHKDTFVLMSSYAVINDSITLYRLDDIHLVNVDKEYGDDIDIWFGERIHMDLNDLESLCIIDARR